MGEGQGITVIGMLMIIDHLITATVSSIEILKTQGVTYEKMARRTKGRQGISRQVRTTTFVHPAVEAGPSGPTADKIIKVLGFKAHANAVKESRERVRQRQIGKCS